MNIGSYYVRRVLNDGTVEWFTRTGWTTNQADAYPFKSRSGADESVFHYYRRNGLNGRPGSTHGTATGDWWANH